MLFKLILLAQCTVAGAYGFIELIFVENMNLWLKVASLLVCAGMYHWGCKAFKKNWYFFCEDEQEVVARKKQVRRAQRRMAA